MTDKLLVDDILIETDYPMIRFYEEALSRSTVLPPAASFVEVGTRSGHASILLLKAIRDSQKERWLFTIDPYGDKPYGHGKRVSVTFDYGEQHYRNAMYSLSLYAWKHNLLHHHYRMRSQEFAFMQENVEFWHKGDILKPQYGFVYLDGEHTIEAINTELSYFLPRLVPGAMVVIDDVSLIIDELDELSIKGEIYHDKLFCSL